MAQGQAKRLITTFCCLLLIAAGWLFPPLQTRAEGLPTELFVTEVQVSDSEFIELYNPYDHAISLQNWQLKYRGSGASETTLKTFAASDTIAAKGFMVLSRNFTTPPGVTNFTFSASLANSAGYIVLYNPAGTPVDLVGWGSGALAKQGSAAAVPVTNQSIQRCFIQNLLALSEPRDNSLEFLIYSQVSPGAGVACVEPEPVDLCHNLEGNQETIPAGLELDQSNNCIEPVSCLLEISEISAQANFTGQEYVELYNSGQAAASVALCKLQINSATNRSLPDLSLSPGAWLTIPFANGTIRNTAGQIALVNSNSEQLTYLYPETVTGQTINFDGGSQTGKISDKATPGVANEMVLLSEEELAVVTGVSALAPCPAGKYRNPETNRCRNLEAATTALIGCEVGQERNPETNRCRKLDTSTLTLCREGQERNPETNRCRKITDEDDLTPCQPGQERNPETNRCRKVAVPASTALAAAGNTAAINPMRFNYQIVALILSLVLGYGLYEYRTDLMNFYQKVWVDRRKGRPPG